jgi:hypothetical protein
MGTFRMTKVAIKEVPKGMTIESVVDYTGRRGRSSCADTWGKAQTPKRYIAGWFPGLTRALSVAAPVWPI